MRNARCVATGDPPFFLNSSTIKARFSQNHAMCTLQTACTPLFDDVLPTTVRDPHPKLWPSQIGVFFLPQIVYTRCMYKTALHTCIKVCTGSHYCVHGLATGQTVPHPATPVPRITPLETSKLVKRLYARWSYSRWDSQKTPTKPSQTASRRRHWDRLNSNNS